MGTSRPIPVKSTRLLARNEECSEGLKLVELSVEAFRSRLETYFTPRSFVSLRGGGIGLKKKLCFTRQCEGLVGHRSCSKELPAIQTVVNSPVFAEDEGGNLTVLNQGYHRCNGGIYVLRKREINTRLRKCAPDFQFKHYAEGDLLTHIEKHSDYYLSCAFTIIREWHAREKPRTNETRHDFREWSRPLDWITSLSFRLCLTAIVTNSFELQARD
jgi:hypothetical protein